MTNPREGGGAEGVDDTGSNVRRVRGRQEQSRLQWKQCQTLFFWAPKSLQMVTAAMKLKDT